MDSKILSVPKLRTYRTYKTSYNVEKYVLMNLSRRQRSVLAQYRIGILPLRVETGRYIGEKPEERICKICQSGQIEDEMHLLRKPIGDISHDGLGQDWTLRRYILHLNDI